MVKLSEMEHVKTCSSNYVLAIKDTINVMSGKWKLSIIGSLLYGKRRFKELEREIQNITPRMLSKELKELELNGIVKRSVFDSTPVVIEYELTASGKMLEKVIEPMIEWGLNHRKQEMGK